MVNFVKNFPHCGCHGNRVLSAAYRVVEHDVMTFVITNTHVFILNRPMTNGKD